ncbi:MAG TPA: hypothetical protein VE641_06305 [Chthoniobacterales bacterium]|nr:hypothetical protein [Chthoniobacterales bacterium]
MTPNDPRTGVYNTPPSDRYRQQHLVCVVVTAGKEGHDSAH